jgi:glycosyltransferase involved in cell wall biosynthesis
VKIGIDESALIKGFKDHHIRGIGRYVSSLKKYLPTAIAEYNSLASKKLELGRFDFQDLKCSAWLDRMINHVPYGQQTIRQQLIYPCKLNFSKTKEFDFLHFPAQMDPPAWSLKPYVVTVLDLIPLVLSELYKADSGDWRFKLARSLELRAISGAKRIIAISQSTANDVNRILKIPFEKIDVTPLGIDKFFYEDCEPSAKNKLVESFNIPSDPLLILYVGGIDPRKNIYCLLEIFSKLVESLPNERSRLRLVIAGKIENERNFPKLLADIKKLGLADFVILTGYLEDKLLLALYKLATLFIFPSLYEGFGLPALEALATGLPVVSTNTSSLPEVLSDSALWFNPNSSEEGFKQALELINNRELCQRLSFSGKQRAQLFSWQNTAKLTVESYAKLAH